MADFYANAAGALGTGDGSSEANACTLHHFVTNNAILYAVPTDGDICWVKADPSGTINRDTQQLNTFRTNNIGNPIRIVGYTSTIGDGGVAAFSVTGSTSVPIIASSAGHNGWHWENLKFTGGYAGVDLPTGSNAWFFYNVTIQDMSVYGWRHAANTGDAHRLCRCAAVSNGGNGFEISGRAPSLVACLAAGNSGIGFSIGNAAYGATATNCIAHSNTGDGFYLNGESQLSNCIADNNNGVGFNVRQSPTLLFMCVASSNGTYGINTSGLAVAVACNLHPSDGPNTSGKQSGGNPLIEQDGLTGTVAWADDSPTNPEDVDLTPGTGSGAVGIDPKVGGQMAAGTGRASLGPYAPVASGGGGGGFIQNGSGRFGVREC